MCGSLWLSKSVKLDLDCHWSRTNSILPWKWITNWFYYTNWFESRLAKCKQIWLTCLWYYSFKTVNKINSMSLFFRGLYMQIFVCFLPCLTIPCKRRKSKALILLNHNLPINQIYHLLKFQDCFLVGWSMNKHMRLYISKVEASPRQVIADATTWVL